MTTVTLKTYAEEHGRASINWFERIQKLARTKKLNSRIDPGRSCIAMEVQYLMLWQLSCASARNWVTCAVGNQCNELPRDKNGVPLDYALAQLGALFHRCIEREEYDQALAVLHQIENRTATILKTIIGHTPTQPSRLQVVDEATGVPPEVYTPLNLPHPMCRCTYPITPPKPKETN